jgi:hypothetical protein
VAELALRSLHTDAAREGRPRPRAPGGQPRGRARTAGRSGGSAGRARSARRPPPAPDGEQTLRLDEVEALLASDALVVDACRRGWAPATAWLPLARRPILFALGARSPKRGPAMSTAKP